MVTYSTASTLRVGTFIKDTTKISTAGQLIRVTTQESWSNVIYLILIYMLSFSFYNVQNLISKALYILYYFLVIIIFLSP